MSTAAMTTPTLFLMRHAQGAWADPPATRDCGSVLSAAGRSEAEGVARRLAETLRNVQARVSVVAHADDERGTNPEPAATLKVVLTTLAAAGALEVDPEARIMVALSPSSLSPNGVPARELERRVGAAAAEVSHLAGGGVALVVGNEPQMSWTARHLCGTSVPIARAAIVGLVRERTAFRRERWRVRWVIEPTDAKAEEDLRTKIRSKMDAAKVLGGFITALVTFVLGQRLSANRSWASLTTTERTLWIVAVAALVASAWLYFVTLFFYDRLLMPFRYWPSGRPARARWLVERPPSSGLWVLYQNMMRVWRLFTAATLLVGVGLAGLTTLLSRPAKPADTVPAFALAIALVAILTAASRFGRPQLGVND